MNQTTDRLSKSKHGVGLGVGVECKQVLRGRILGGFTISWQEESSEKVCLRVCLLPSDSPQGCFLYCYYCYYLYGLFKVGTIFITEINFFSMSSFFSRLLFVSGGTTFPYEKSQILDFRFRTTKPQ